LRAELYRKASSKFIKGSNAIHKDAERQNLSKILPMSS